MRMKHAAPLLMALLLCSCETIHEAMRAEPLPPTPFLPNHELLVSQRASFPFNKMWYDKGLDWSRLTKLKFDAVNTSNMQSDKWWSGVSEASAFSMRKDIPELAGYMRTSFIRHTAERTNGRLQIVDKVDSHTAIVQLAIVQLVPTKAFFNAVGTTAGFFIPGAGLVNMFNTGSIAMECKVIDGKTGKVIAMLTDRAKDETAIIDVNSYTWYGHAKETIDVWAEGFSELAAAKDAAKIRKGLPVNLISF